MSLTQQYKEQQEKLLNYAKYLGKEAKAFGYNAIMINGVICRNLNDIAHTN